MKSTINFSKSVLLAALIGVSLNSNAQEESKGTTKVSGSVDGFYKFDAGRSNSSLTSFTKAHNSFELGSANIQAEHSMGKAKFFADLGVGNRIDEINQRDNGSVSLVKELNFTYEVISGLEVTAGTFQRHYGVEKINAISNSNYSMSYSFSTSPLLNTGFKINYKFDEFNVMVGFANPHDFKSSVAANTTQKTVLAQVGYATETTKVNLNYQSASNDAVNPNLLTQLNRENYNLFNLTACHKVDDKLSLSLDANYRIKTFDYNNYKKEVLGVAAYVKYAVKEDLKLTYRLEYFDDSKFSNEVALKGGNVISNTVTANYTVGNLTIVPELRGDFSSKNVFFESNNTKGVKYNAAFLIAGIYKF